MLVTLVYCDFQLSMFTFVFHYTLQALPAGIDIFKIKVMPTDFMCSYFS
jgi:hypothetical protein